MQLERRPVSHLRSVLPDQDVPLPWSSPLGQPASGVQLLVTPPVDGDVDVRAEGGADVRRVVARHALRLVGGGDPQRPVSGGAGLTPQGRGTLRIVWVGREEGVEDAVEEEDAGRGR